MPRAAPTRPGSLLRLEENQSVTTRVTSGIAIQSTGNPAKPYPWLRVVNGRLSFGLYPVYGEPHGWVMSDNTIAIELRSSSENVDGKQLPVRRVAGTRSPRSAPAHDWVHTRTTGSARHRDLCPLDDDLRAFQLV